MIHQPAIVSSDCQIAESAAIWEFAKVIRGAHIGARCSVGGCAIVDAAKVGDDCAIGHGAQLHPGTVIGASVFVGPGVIFCNDSWPRVSKDGFDGDALLSGAFVTVKVEDEAVIGARCVILPGVIIGRGALIAAGSRVEKSVPAYHLHKANGEIVPLAPRKAERMRAAA